MLLRPGACEQRLQHLGTALFLAGGLRIGFRNGWKKLAKHSKEEMMSCLTDSEQLVTVFWKSIHLYYSLLWRVGCQHCTDLRWCIIWHLQDVFFSLIMKVGHFPTLLKERAKANGGMSGICHIWGWCTHLFSFLNVTTSFDILVSVSLWVSLLIARKNYLENKSSYKL